jgi:hypothetical protein
LSILSFLRDFGEMLKREVSSAWTLRVFIKLCFLQVLEKSWKTRSAHTDIMFANDLAQAGLRGR